MKMARYFVLAALAATAGLGLGIRSGEAADIPVYEVPELVTPSGAYAGLFAGWGWGNTVVSNIDPEVEGFVGGALVGWELRGNGAVFGIEGDFGLTGADGVNTPMGTSADVEWLASVRARVGVERGGAVFYGTGGLAFAGVEAGINTLVPASDSQTLTGYAVGAGAQAGISDTLSARLEYLYYRFDDTNFGVGPVGIQADLRLHTVRAALIYNFGG
jgi:outer membrane immunogenic protein